jgi:hypothetical protein
MLVFSCSASPIGKYNIYQVHFYGDIDNSKLSICPWILSNKVVYVFFMSRTHALHNSSRPKHNILKTSIANSFKYCPCRSTTTNRVVIYSRLSHLSIVRRYVCMDQTLERKENIGLILSLESSRYFSLDLLVV